MTTQMNQQYVVIETSSSQMQLIQNDTKADVAAEVLSSVVAPDQADMSTSDQQPVIMFKWGSQKKPFRCQLCDMAFDDGTRMCEHMVKHGDSFPQKPFPCKVCPKSFLSAKSLERHTLSHYGQALKRCKFCYKVFANKENLEKHVLVHGGSKPHKCTLCSDQFVYRQGLETHMMTHTGVRPYVCNICNKGFNRKDILERHMHVHNGGGKRYKCVECDKTFSHSFVLKRHARSIHSGEEEGAYCPVCNKYIKSKENLGRHMKIHTGDRPFKCEHCERAFNQKQHLLDHMVVHTGGTPHECKVCNELFKHKRSLNRHLLKHKEKDVVCPKCPMRFTETEEMSKHLKKHESRKFQCKECFLLFKLGSSLKRHYWKAHEEKTWSEDGSEGIKQFNNMSTTTDDLHLYNEIVSKYEEEMEKNPDNETAYNIQASDQMGVTEELLSGLEREQVILIVLENDSEKLEEGDLVEQEVQELVAKTETQENPEILEVRDVEESSADVKLEHSTEETVQKVADGKQTVAVASTAENVVGKKLIPVTENRLVHPRVVRRFVQRSVAPKSAILQNQPNSVSVTVAAPGQGMNSLQLTNSVREVVGPKRIVVRKVQQSSESDQPQRSRTIILQQVKTPEGQSKVILGSTGSKMGANSVPAPQDVTVSTEVGSQNSQSPENQVVQILQASETGMLACNANLTMDTAQEKGIIGNEVQYVTVSAKGDNSTTEHMDTDEGTENFIDYQKSSENSLSDSIGTIIKVEDESVVQYNDQRGSNSDHPIVEGDITQPGIIYTHVADSNAGHVTQLQPVAMGEGVAELDDRSMLIQTVIDYAERQIRESNQSQEQTPMENV